MSYEVTDQRDNILIRIFGTTKPSELNRLLNDIEVLEDSHSSSKNQITDITRVERFDIGFMDINALATRRRTRQFSRPIKVAIVVEDPLQFGLARMYETLNENPQVSIRICQSTNEAETWFREV